jgi:hypothetical protein
MNHPEILQMMEHQETSEDARVILNRLAELIDTGKMPADKGQALAHIVGVRNSVEKNRGPDDDKPWMS